MDERYRVYRAWAVQRFIKQTGFCTLVLSTIACRVLEAATATGWRENRLLEGVSGSIPSSLGVRKPKRISRGSQIRARAALRLEVP